MEGYVVRSYQNQTSEKIERIEKQKTTNSISLYFKV